MSSSKAQAQKKNLQSISLDFLNCFSEDSKKMVLRDSYLQKSLAQDADGKAFFFGWRYGNYGGSSLRQGIEEKYPVDALDLACFLYRYELNPYNLQKGVQQLRSQGRVKTSAQPFVDWIIHPIFPSLMKLWQYSNLIYLVSGVSAFLLFGTISSVLNTLLGCRALFDFFTCTPREYTINLLIFSTLFFLDLFIAFKWNFARKLSVLPILFRFALLIFSMHFGTNPEFVIAPPPNNFLQKRNLKW